MKVKPFTGSANFIHVETILFQFKAYLMPGHLTRNSCSINTRRSIIYTECIEHEQESKITDPAKKFKGCQSIRKISLFFLVMSLVCTLCAPSITRYGMNPFVAKRRRSIQDKPTAVSKTSSYFQKVNLYLVLSMVEGRQQAAGERYSL